MRLSPLDDTWKRSRHYPGDHQPERRGSAYRVDCRVHGPRAGGLQPQVRSEVRAEEVRPQVRAILQLRPEERQGRLRSEEEEMKVDYTQTQLLLDRLVSEMMSGDDPYLADPIWVAVFRRVPRHVFLPGFYIDGADST